VHGAKLFAFTVKKVNYSSHCVANRLTVSSFKGACQKYCLARYARHDFRPPINFFIIRPLEISKCKCKEACIYRYMKLNLSRAHSWSLLMVTQYCLPPIRFMPVRRNTALDLRPTRPYRTLAFSVFGPVVSTIVVYGTVCYDKRTLLLFVLKLCKRRLFRWQGSWCSMTSR